MQIDDCRHPICHCCADHLDKDGFCSDACRMRSRKGLECACEHKCGETTTTRRSGRTDAGSGRAKAAKA